MGMRWTSWRRSRRRMMAAVVGAILVALLIWSLFGPVLIPYLRS